MAEDPGSAIDGRVLLRIARAAIGSRLGRSTPPVEDAPWLSAPGATFVTLTAGGSLRGCIGSLRATRPLRDDVAGNAVHAAFDDRRFRPVTAAEFDGLRVEVSVLSQPEPFDFESRADALARLRPHVDGVILLAAGRRATFLPQVWEQLPDPDRFLAHLLAKAGLPRNHWDESVRLERYTVRSWEEER